jgi:hypothetical protein
MTRTGNAGALARTEREARTRFLRRYAWPRLAGEGARAPSNQYLYPIGNLKLTHFVVFGSLTLLRVSV